MAGYLSCTAWYRCSGTMGVAPPSRPCSKASHAWYIEHARDRDVVAPADEREARDELLHGHLGCRSHHRLPLWCEDGGQSDVWEAAADTDEGAERDATQE